jgi:hypothetical protein
MSFEYPSTITARKEKKKAEEKKKEQKMEKDFTKAVKPVFDKKEGIKKELAIMQFEDAISTENVGKGLDKKIMKGDMSSVKK